VGHTAEDGTFSMNILNLSSGYKTGLRNDIIVVYVQLPYSSTAQLYNDNNGRDSLP
jgi:hypothetical protein